MNWRAGETETPVRRPRSRRRLAVVEAATPSSLEGLGKAIVRTVLGRPESGRATQEVNAATRAFGGRGQKISRGRQFGAYVAAARNVYGMEIWRYGFGSPRFTRSERA